MINEPVRLGAPDGRVAQVDGVTGRRYKADGGGMYTMHPADAAAFKREGAFVPTIGGPTIRGGYQCPRCGFMAVIRTCSRCGARCETGDERRARLAKLASDGPATGGTVEIREIVFGAPVDCVYPLRGGLQLGSMHRGELR